MKNGWQWALVSKELTLGQNWQQRLSQYQNLYIGYSGGLDSTVLLTLVTACPQLRQKVTAIHVHHGLSTHADQWLEHCQQYCQRLEVPCVGIRVAISPGANLEERARIARYNAFEEVLGTQDALLLAHHQNDQSETVLLNLLRGTGLDGLCAMPEQRVCGKGMVLRPLLHLPRKMLSDYAEQQGLQWIEDEMNAACEWSRVYLRQKIIPLLQVKWPNLSATVAMSAQHCQQAKALLDTRMAEVYPDLSDKKLEITSELQDDTLRCTQLLRAWLKQHLSKAPSRACIQQILETVIQASQDAMPSLQIDQVILRRYKQTLYLCEVSFANPHDLVWATFPEPIAWTHDCYIVATLDHEHGIPIAPESCIKIKVRKGGESIQWHGQTQNLKKLLQTWCIPPWERAILPLIYINNQLIAVPPYAQSGSIESDTQHERYSFTVCTKP